MKDKFVKSKSLLAMFDHPGVPYDVDESGHERLFDHIVPLPHYRPPVEKGKDKKEKESHSQTVQEWVSTSQSVLLYSHLLFSNPGLVTSHPLSDRVCMSEQVESNEKHVETAKVANTSVLVVAVFVIKTM